MIKICHLQNLHKDVDLRSWKEINPDCGLKGLFEVLGHLHTLSVATGSSFSFTSAGGGIISVSPFKKFVFSRVGLA